MFFLYLWWQIKELNIHMVYTQFYMSEWGGLPQIQHIHMLNAIRL